MAKNQLKKFGTGARANIIDYATWENLPDLETGFQSGIAHSNRLNYLFAQGALAGNVLGDFVVEFAKQDATLKTDLYAHFKTSLKAYIKDNLADRSVTSQKLAGQISCNDITFQLKQANSSTRKKTVYQPGEVVFDTDEKKLYVGDGKTQGGKGITPELPEDIVRDATFNSSVRTLSGLSLTAGNGASYGSVKFKTGSSVIEARAEANDLFTLYDIHNSRNYLQINGSQTTVFSDLNISNKKITNLAKPTNANDGANKQYVDQAVSAGTIPPGTAGLFFRKTVPDGWLLCNGASVSRTTYAKLFEAIGTTYGSGDGHSTFSLPNVGDRFLQPTVVTADVGKTVEAGLPNITGRIRSQGAPRSWPDWYGGFYDLSGAFAGGKPTQGSTGVKNDDEGTQTYSDANFNASQSNAIYGRSSTVQPASLKCLCCVKF